ncbi:glucose-6-phosphate exchanger SLC37A2-like [Lineus longissimus]|uniref:glucose-6-phosphate exchanger SLC37A2-like n=1 Tax=Lineus longissimus TaxID=88925 RepID=UPI002B4C702C
MKTLRGEDEPLKMDHDPRNSLCAPPLGIRAVKHCCNCNKKASWRVYILLYTFVIYITYHMSRLPISIVKSVLHRNCTRGEFEELLNKSALTYPNTSAAKDEILMKKCSWVPFEGSNYEELYGTLDYAFLLCYALGLFISGQIAERTHIRYFLTAGMIFSGFFVILFGLGHVWRIHSFAYYLTVQILGGFAQSSGWPCVVTCVANWFGDTKKGLILGIWNTHINIGNILGALVPGIWVKTDWGMSFMVPGLLIMCMGVTVFFWIVPYPEELGFNGTSAVTEEVPLKDAKTQPKDDKPSEESSLIKKDEQKAISILGALRIPGVVEFSIGLFFIKLVSYTFLFWLPKYISSGGTVRIDPQTAASLTALFDVGGMFGGILIGLLSDILGIKAILCVVFLLSAAWPMFHVYQIDGSTSQGLYAAFLIITGLLVNGPYALITTAVSAELGNHPCLQGNARAMSTVAAIIDGTGSLGAAFGPLITGIIATYGWNKVFAMLILSDLVAALMLMRLFVSEAKDGYVRFKNWKRKRKEGKENQDTTPLEEDSQDIRSSAELGENESSKDR